jgi:hypothetical protein
MAQRLPEIPARWAMLYGQPTRGRTVWTYIGDTLFMLISLCHGQARISAKSRTPATFPLQFFAMPLPYPTRKFVLLTDIRMS